MRAALALLLAGAACCAPPSRGLALVGGTLIDAGHDGLADSLLVVEGARIVAAGAQSHVTLPKGVAVLDARGRFVLPLVDAVSGPEAVAALERRVAEGASPAEALRERLSGAHLAPGASADLLVLERDPREDPAHLASVHARVRAGRLAPAP